MQYRMQMTDEEIKRNILEAKDQKAQIQIMADLNAVKPEVIRDVLKKQGLDLRQLKGGFHRSPAGNKKNRPHAKPAETAQAKIEAALELLMGHAGQLCEQREALKKQLQAIEDEIVAINLYINKIDDKLTGRSEQ